MSPSKSHVGFESLRGRGRCSSRFHLFSLVRVKTATRVPPSNAWLGTLSSPSLGLARALFSDYH
ncbi:hypothetical protein SBV1_1890036 [Verrucomicrobia bacterium]|nr:hypothetical protein SBV1_1890036 [Verrucomicrobiota bacterium]